MNILEIIDKKRNKLELTTEEINFFITGVCDDSIKDYQISSLLMAICINGMTMRETSAFTLAMASSGERMDYNALGLHNTLDKHSTGGVGDTTTLILIPALMALGYKVGKMSGRGLGLTGGTLDKLESIKNFNINYDLEHFARQVLDIGGAIIGQSKELCPADKKLYALRDATATVRSIPLIASSIMSKKIASGAENIVIDVKCGKGAFMKSEREAIELGETMTAIGALTKVNVSYIVTNMSAPLGDYVGNSLEIFGALEVLGGVKNRLYEVTLALGNKLLTSLGVKNAKDALAQVIASGAAKEKFIELVAAQGGDVECVKDPYRLLTANCKSEIFAQREGYITSVDANIVAQTVFDLGGGRLNKDSVIDYAVGVRTLRFIGDFVREGEPLAEMYYNNYRDVASLEQLAKAFEIGDSAVEYPLIIKE